MSFVGTLKTEYRINLINVLFIQHPGDLIKIGTGSSHTGQIFIRSPGRTRREASLDAAVPNAQHLGREGLNEYNIWSAKNIKKPRHDREVVIIR